MQTQQNSTKTDPRWRPAKTDDIETGTRVMLARSKRKGVVMEIMLDDPKLVIVAVDGRLPTDDPIEGCFALGMLLVPAG